MEEKLYKYANLLINGCLSNNKNILLISSPLEAYSFVRIISSVAYKSGYKEIYFDWKDNYIKIEGLKYLNDAEIKNNSIFSREVFDKYTQKGASFLILTNTEPDIMKDTNDKKLALANKIYRESSPLFNKEQLEFNISWCIAAVPNYNWARKVLPNSNYPIEELWNKIFDICFINEKDPIDKWKKTLETNKIIVNKLNNLNIKKLIYKNKLGTNFSIEVENNIWIGSEIKDKLGNNIIVNMPTFEIFTSPNKYSANGIVYSSIPLNYNGSIIDKFWLEFKNGKVINYNAEIGKENLKSIIKTTNGNYLGEVALVDNSSPISKSNTLFYNTLYDENASCHLALGEGFKECIKNFENYEKSKLNHSKTHVDFMIGTNDLEIIADTKNGFITLMKDGKITI